MTTQHLAHISALVAVATANLVTSACGGGSGTSPDAAGDPSDATTPDAAPACTDPAFTAPCFPGCGDGEKCTSITVAAGLSQTDCVPAGAVPLGGTCTVGEPGLDTGYDDCVSGAFCRGGICVAVCSNAPDSCGSCEACTILADTFDDVGPDVGLCARTCDPVGQLGTDGQPDPGYDDCPDGQGCFLAATTGKSTCSSIPAGAMGKGQNEVCFGPSGTDNCFLNGCDVGYQAILFEQRGGPTSVCGGFCGPVETYLGHAGNDADGAGPHDCSTARVGVAGQGCRFVQSIFDSSQFDGEVISSTVGLCADEATWGDCEAFDPAGQVAAYNTAYTAAVGDATAKAEAAARAMCLHCGLTTDCCDDPSGAACDGQVVSAACQDVGCTTIATQDAFDAMYLGATAKVTVGRIRELVRRQAERAAQPGSAKSTSAR